MDSELIVSFFEENFKTQPRPQQIKILNKIECDNQSIIANAGTGIGKSLIAVAACLMRGRGIIVAPNRPLQWQYMNEPLLKDLFDSGTLAVLMGKSNYPCRARGCYYCQHHETELCSNGKGCNLFIEDESADEKIITCGDVDFDEDCKICRHHPDRCDVFHDMCYYFAARQRAKAARVVVVNTAILFFAKFILPTPYDIIVYDEAHQLEDFYRMLFSQGVILPKVLHYANKILNLGMNEVRHKDGKIVTVEEYFRKTYPKISEVIDVKRLSSDKSVLSMTPQHYRKIVENYKILLERTLNVDSCDVELEMDIQQNLKQVQDLLDNFDKFNFVLEVNKRSLAFKCEPVYVDFIHKKHIDISEKHLLMSATVFKGYTDVVLGIQGSEYFEVDNEFPPENCPIFVVKDESGKRENREKFLNFFCDSFTRLAPKLKGRTLVHTISRDNQFRIMQQLPKSVRDRVIEVRSVQEYLHKLDEYKSREDAILMSYSLKEGIDLKGDLCSTVVILHASLPNPGSAIVKAYLKLGLQVYDYTTASSLAQAAGRAVRSSTDKARIILYDNRFLEKKSLKRWLPPQWRRAYAKRKAVNG